MNLDEVFPVFIGVWIVLGIISFSIFVLGRDAKLKRKLWMPFVIGVGILFVSFGYLTGIGEQLFLVMVPAVILITYLNIKSTKFCDNCGKMIFNQNIFQIHKFCSRCGEKLQ